MHQKLTLILRGYLGDFQISRSKMFKMSQMLIYGIEHITSNKTVSGIIILRVFHRDMGV